VVPAVSPGWRGAGWRILSCVLGLCVLACGVARAAGPPSTPQSRLLNVWLDLRLVALFYPDTSHETLLANLAKVAGQLGQPLPPIRFGETARDARKLRMGAVLIKQHPPPDTLVLFTRGRSVIWRLVDDAEGRLKLVRISSP
jgi:hypothetical protein